MGSFNLKTKFVPDADIAGVGIFAALLIQATLIYVLAALVFASYNFGRKTKPLLYCMLFSLSDIFTVLAIVYIINFMGTGNCTMSTNHYYVTLDSVLISCSTMAVTFTAPKHLYLKTVAGVLRFLVTVAMFVLLGILLVYQMYTNSNTDFPELIPPDIKTRKDSALLLLPVSCFFDPDLIAKRNPYSPNLTPPLCSKRLDRIGHPLKNSSLSEFWIYVSLALLLLIETLAACCGCCGAPQQNHNFAKRRTRGRRNGVPYMRVLGFLIFFICLGTDIFCLWHIWGLKEWARQSGWLNNNSENDLFSVGQLMAALSLISFAFAFLDDIKIYGGSSKSPEYYNV